jgi:signal transduction histidine kinase
VNRSPETARSRLTRFRVKLLLAIMLVVSAITALGVYLVQRNAMAVLARDLQRDFQTQLAALHAKEELRNAALAERCRTLVSKPRIHAALEDNALDLLYPTAKDELRDLMAAVSGNESSAASFYRFLNSTGAVIPPSDPADVGVLEPGEEAQLAMRGLRDQQQTGYLFRRVNGVTEAVEQIIAVPIFSSDNGNVIAALVVGFRSAELTGGTARPTMRSGIWLDRQMHLPGLPRAAQIAINDELTRILRSSHGGENSVTTAIGDAPHLLFYKRLNPGSVYPAAYEVSVYPLSESIARQRRLQREIIVAGIALLAAAFVASQFASRRLARPVEELAVESDENRAQRAEAEATLATRNVELQRSARFSADASHQLKTPVTVLRAGIESLLGREGFAPHVYDELSSLLHQTYRLTGVIEDLLLLSRMDAGRLELEFDTVNLTQLIEEWVDDFSAIPDPFELEVETKVPPNLRVVGEKRYTTLIVQNLLENARKYNRRGGRIRIAAEQAGEQVVLTIGNTGRGISPAGQEHIFERFHRGSMGENVPGHGLGLNLARELARLHGGDLHLAQSENDWTEFEVCFRAAERPQAMSVAAK